MIGSRISLPPLSPLSRPEAPKTRATTGMGLHPTEMAQPQEEDEEDDFMSDKFILAASKPSTSSSSTATTYAERRRKAQIISEQKGRVKSRAEREKEAREEALGKDLIQDGELPVGGEGESKAVKMMRKMGFTPGQALGVKRAAPSEDLPSTNGAGLGAKSTPPPTDDRRTVPIPLHLRGPGKLGLGVPGTSAPKRPTPLSHLAGAFSSLAASASAPSSATEFLEHSRSRFSGRKVEGALRRARRTCEELDRRIGMEENVMWTDPEEEAKEVDRRIRRRLDDGEALVLDDAGNEPIGVGRQSRLAKLAGKEKGYSRTVVEVDEEEAAKASEERETWFLLDAPTRLALLLDYLRTEHRSVTLTSLVQRPELTSDQVLPLVWGPVRFGRAAGRGMPGRGRRRPLRCAH